MSYNFSAKVQKKSQINYVYLLKNYKKNTAALGGLRMFNYNLLM